MAKLYKHWCDGRGVAGPGGGTVENTPELGEKKSLPNS